MRGKALRWCSLILLAACEAEVDVIPGPSEPVTGPGGSDAGGNDAGGGDEAGGSGGMGGSTPARLPGAHTLAVGAWEVFSVREDGTLFEWTLFGTVAQPFDASVWTSVTAGDEHFCGIKDDGSLWCWGNNDY